MRRGFDIGRAYRLIYTVNGRPETATGRYVGVRALTALDGEGHAFDTGRSLLVLTEDAITDAFDVGTVA